MPTIPTTPSSKSGITTSETGERHIPSSTRADGSVRKEIRVRPGYRPPEDVEVYKNRTAEAWKSRGSGGVPGAEPLVKERPLPGAVNKNTKRREARKRAAAEGNAGEGSADGVAIESADGGHGNTEGEPAAADPELEKEKDAKKLMKKLRQARELKDKKEKGGTLLPEQFEKVIKINELIRLLDNLGFDGEGARKDEI